MTVEQYVRSGKLSIIGGHKLKVLHHHPDKRRARGEAVQSDSEDYFVCITHAFEQLGDPEKPDPSVDDRVPSSKETYTAKNFYKEFSIAFARNARWSNNHPVPELGDKNSSEQHIEKFYSFWFEFSSWREFSYLDEEDKDRGENREERRWIERENRAERQARRKAEMKRIRDLVELAYKNDPRVIKMMEDQKNAKLAQKQAKRDAVQAKRDLEEKTRKDAAEAERVARETAEALEKEKLTNQRKAKEAHKKALKQQRKRLVELCEKNTYYSQDSAIRLERCEGVGKLCTTLELLELTELNEHLMAEPNGCSHEQTLVTHIELVDKRLEQGSDALTNQTKTSAADQLSGLVDSKWTDDENDLLVKACTLFPVGTKQRWEVIAEFINEHRSEASKKAAKDRLKSGRDVVNRVKQLSQAAGDRAAASEDLVSTSTSTGAAGIIPSKKDGQHRIESVPTERTDQTDSTAWSAEEQKTLEQALRTYNSSVEDRWDKIAACLPNRSKKDCMRRFKEIAELVKAKKAAQSKVAASAKK